MQAAPCANPKGSQRDKDGESQRESEIKLCFKGHMQGENENMGEKRYFTVSTCKSSVKNDSPLKKEQWN